MLEIQEYKFKMMNYEKQVKVFKKTIPIGLKSVPELIDLLGNKVDIKEISIDSLPPHKLQFAKSNANHCIYNDVLNVAPENMIFRTFEVIRNEKSVPYLKDNPRGSVHVIFEERTVYISSDSNQLFRELEYARGVTKEEYENEGMQFRCLLSHIAIAYDEEHNIINMIKSFIKKLKLPQKK